MFKRIILAAAVLSPLAGAGDALALDTGLLYKVCFDHEVVGTWRMRNRVVDIGNSCRYTVKWQNLHEPSPPLKRTTLCRLDEFKASDNFDCERNRRRFFPTLVQLSPQSSCTGFDDFGQQTPVTRLVAGVSDEGLIVGIVETSSVGDVQNLTVVPND